MRVCVRLRDGNCASICLERKLLMLGSYYACPEDPQNAVSKALGISLGRRKLYLRFWLDSFFCGRAHALLNFHLTRAWLVANAS